MVESGEGQVDKESSKKKDSSTDDLYRKLENLKSMLDIDFSIKKDDPVDCILIVVHGIGTTDNMLENDYKSLKRSLEVVRKHWFYNQKLKVHLLFINWKKYIVDAQNTLFENVSIDTVKGMRRAFTLAMLDITFYLNPKFSDFLISSVADDINNEITTLRNHPSGLFKNSKLAMIGYSMGSVIVDDLIRVNPDRISNVEVSKRPKIEHEVDYFFAVGSPLSCSLVYHTPQLIKTGFVLPKNIKCYNIFHPYDPIACRWEKLVYRDVADIPKPVIVPYWYNNGLKNWYNLDQQFQYCKSLITENLSDISNTITKGLSNLFGGNQNNSVLDQNITNSNNRKLSFNNFRNSNIVYFQNLLELKSKIVSDILDESDKTNMDKNEEKKDEEEDEEEFFSDFEVDNSSTNALEKANSNSTLPIRYDYQVQEDATEHFLSPLAILQSHISYWGSRDVSFFILKSIHEKKERVPITTLLTYIESKARALSLTTTDEELKKEFMAVSEKSKKILDQISKEEINFKNESIIGLKSTWNFMTKTNDGDNVHPYESHISDRIEQEDNNVEIKE